MGGISGSAAGPGSQPLGLLLPPSASHPSMAQKQMMVLALGLPMTRLKQSQGCRPSPRGPSGAGKGRKAGQAKLAAGSPQMPGLLLLDALPFRPLMKTPGLERGCLLLLLDLVRLSLWADFHSPWSPPFLGPHFSCQSQDRESVFFLEMFSPGVGPGPGPGGRKPSPDPFPLLRGPSWPLPTAPRPWPS